MADATTETAQAPFRGLQHPREPDLPAVPIVLGVAGHRDLRPGDREALTKALTQVFQQFRDAYKHTPIVLLSALAQGADQLAADVALQNGLFVRAPLPFEPQIFRASTSFDPDNELARNHLDELLADTEHVESFEAPMPRGHEPEGTDLMRVATADDDDSRNRRRARYANAGAYIVRRCQVLIALWDGREGDPSRPSGTAEHVQFKLKGEPLACDPRATAEPLGYRGECGPVVVIPTPRAQADPEDPALLAQVGPTEIWMPPQPPNDASADSQPPRRPLNDRYPIARRRGPWTRFGARLKGSLTGHKKPSEKTEEQHFGDELRQVHEICQTIDDFNRDLARPKVAAQVRNRLQEPNEFAAPHFDARETTWLLRISTFREAAAAISSHLQPWLNGFQGLLFILLGLGFVFFHVYAHWFEVDTEIGNTVHNPYWLISFAVLLALSIGVVLFDWFLRLESRRLDSRALAEALRVRRAWAIAGVPESVADSYLGQLRGELSWVRNALFHVCPPPRLWADQFERLGDDKKRAHLERVRDEWIVGKGGQIRQYHKTHKREHNRAFRWRVGGLILAFAGWALLVLLLFQAPHTPAEPGVEAAASHHVPSSRVHPAHWMLLLSSCLVIVGGLCIAYNERCSHEELSKQYERMEIVFKNGHREFEKRLAAGDFDKAQEVLKALGREALTEHSQWLILRRARPVELHIG